MEIITKAARMRAICRKLWAEEMSIGFVPTMGALHEGHLGMVRDARRMTDAVVVSIFVNPTQFDSGKDFDRYPRDLARDADLLTPLGVDYIFAPAAQEMYPQGFASFVEVTGLSDKLEGVSRPGHFRGVTTALSILFNLVHPQYVFVGQRDAQQAVIVKKLARDLHLPIEIVVSPIARESDGLACSSRNRYLSLEERRAATVLYRALHRAEELYSDGERSSGKLLKVMRKEIEKEPLAKIDYLAVTDTDQLDPLDDLTDRKALVSIAAFFGHTRLIDNVVLSADRFTAKTGRLKLS
ncbi:MAG TPA: pantoate--beta-alanine ligase [Blastocatellia bacterium]|nr:pantoate--beta-alanine ligase [Blastocatellia bacterium]HMZ20330.1 pantoate--beta-alanine ligase [Blastocatellia bacterium]HNG33744.1 pantoate--beta-alanine ligase [Blastocatellia bacterium]